MKYSLPLLAIFICPVLNAQKTKNPDLFIDSGYLKTKLFAIAGADMEGRQTATNGQRKASLYLQKEFSKIGLKPGNAGTYQQYFDVYRDSITQAAVSVNGIQFIRDSEFGVFTDMNHACDLKFSEASFAGYGIVTEKYNSYKGLDVAGRLVIIYDDEPKLNDSTYLLGNSRQKTMWSYPPPKVQAATKLGASAILVIEKNFPLTLYNNKLSSFWRTPYQFYQGINCFFISEKIAREIFKDDYDKIKDGIKNNALENIQTVKADISLDFSRALLKMKSGNVIGVLEGSEKKNEFICITAHYDHLGKSGKDIYYGADDNASGTAGLLGIANAFSQQARKGHLPKRSILFIAFSGEENGLWGSEYYSEHPVFPLEKTSVAINMDMIGRSDYAYLHDKDSSNFVFVIGNDKLSSELNDVVSNNNQDIGLKLDYRYNNLKDPNYYFYRSDQFNFAAKGVPVLFFLDGENADYHKPTDTPDKINIPLMSRRTNLAFKTAWDLANRPNQLKRDLPLK